MVPEAVKLAALVAAALAVGGATGDLLVGPALFAPAAAPVLSSPPTPLLPGPVKGHPAAHPAPAPSPWPSPSRSHHHQTVWVPQASAVPVSAVPIPTRRTPRRHVPSRPWTTPRATHSLRPTPAPAPTPSVPPTTATAPSTATSTPTPTPPGVLSGSSSP